MSSGSETSGFSVRMFGPFEVKFNGNPLPELRLRSCEPVLAFLTLNHDRALRAEWLAEIFWPDAVAGDELDRALASLRQTVHHLRTALGVEGNRIDTSNKTVSFRLQGVYVDAFEFEEAVSNGSQESLRNAAALYHGPLLEGWSENWVIRERERFRDLYVDALQKLAAGASASEDYTAAARYLRRLLVASPVLEAAWCQLMEVLVRAGERLEAMNIYSRYRDYLFKRGKLEPPARMMALYHEIQHQPAHVAAELMVDFSGYEPVGGAVPLKSAYYIVRDADEELRRALSRQDGIVLIKGPRQIGKTSLLVRGLDHARQMGARLILTDLQKLAAANFDSPDTFLRALAQLIADQLELDVSIDSLWNSSRAPGANFERFVRLEVLNQMDTHVVWGLDEVDRLFPCTFRNDVFGMFRAWFNERAIQPDGLLNRMTLAMGYATEARLFITDLNQSPFNVGTRIALNELNLVQISDLNRKYGSPLKDDRELTQLVGLVGGHPYLIRRAMHEISSHDLSLRSIVQQACREDGIFGDHLERMYVALIQDAGLTQAVRGLVHDGSCPTHESFYRLRSAGVVSGEVPEEVKLRCQLYENYFRRVL